MLIDEYNSLRNEIISFEEQQRNVWIYMYVLFVTLFVLGIELSYNLFLVTYIILIPFQIVINRYRWSISKLSTYIRLFYESNNKDLNWESMHVFVEFNEYYKKFDSSISGIIRYTGVTQLGFLATSFYIGSLLFIRFSKDTFTLSSFDLFLIIISIFLFFLTVMLNREYNRSYTDDLEHIIKKYKDSLNDL